MYTLCSHCQAEYEVVPELLVCGRGWLHCTGCGQDFDALGNLTKEPRGDIAPPYAELALSQRPTADASPEAGAHESSPEAIVAAMEMVEATEVETLEVEATDEVAVEQVEAIAPTEIEVAAPSGNPVEPEPEPAAEVAPKSRSTPAPSFARDRRALPVAAVQRGRGWRWTAIAALTVLLVVQVGLADRARYAGDARTRPWLERLCAVLKCELPPWREPEALRLLARDVRPHPSVPEALIISASFRNDARWPQSWPDLILTLSDINGRAIARRQFLPDEYLGLAARELSIEPGQTASVTLEVSDPGKQAVAFEFEFR